jgi:hypothetical protein
MSDQGAAAEPDDFERDFEAAFAPKPMSREERKARAAMGSTMGAPAPDAFQPVQVQGWRRAFRYEYRDDASL